MAAHDQLLFTARQKVDALSAQMVALQAEVGINANTKMTVDLPALLNRLKEPLPPEDQPRPIPAIDNDSAGAHEMHAHSVHLDGRNIWSDLNKPNEMNTLPAQKRSVVDSNDQALTSGDLDDLLQWIHETKNHEIEKSFAGNNEPAAVHADQKYIDDFIANINHLNFETKPVMDKMGMDGFKGVNFTPIKSNENIINDSLRSIRATHTKRNSKSG